MIKKDPTFFSSYRILAFVFCFLSLGAIGETKRILTSNAPDIAHNRSGLIPMALVMTALFIFLTVYFWRKRNN